MLLFFSVLLFGCFVVVVCCACLVGVCVCRVCSCGVCNLFDVCFNVALLLVCDLVVYCTCCVCLFD